MASPPWPPHLLALAVAEVLSFPLEEEEVVVVCRRPWLPWVMVVVRLLIQELEAVPCHLLVEQVGPVEVEEEQAGPLEQLLLELVVLLCQSSEPSHPAAVVEALRQQKVVEVAEEHYQEEEAEEEAACQMT